MGAGPVAITSVCVLRVYNRQPYTPQRNLLNPKPNQTLNHEECRKSQTLRHDIWGGVTWIGAGPIAITSVCVLRVYTPRPYTPERCFLNPKLHTLYPNTQTLNQEVYHHQRYTPERFLLNLKFFTLYPNPQILNQVAYRKPQTLRRV